MNYDELLGTFGQFGLAILLGVLLGLERELRTGGTAISGIRDFVLFALIGAFSAYLAMRFNAPWFIALGFTGLIAVIVPAYWSERQRGSGLTTELAAIMTFFLGVLILSGATELAIALGIATLGVLFPKAEIKQWSASISRPELQATFLFLTISFIVLPVLPNQTLDHLLTFEAGTISGLDPDSGRIVIKPAEALPEAGRELEIFDKGWIYRGTLIVDHSDPTGVSARYTGEDFSVLAVGQDVRTRLDLKPLYVVLAAVNPYRVWLIVVLVSFVSFLGYVLIKIVGSGAGIGLTGLIGGLVSSTVTTLSFARRSREVTTAVPLFAAAIVLASSIMFPRLIIEIAVFNTALMKHVALPLSVMGITGMLLAGFSFWRSQAAPVVDNQPPAFDNPFSLRSAVAFAAIFAVILAVTKLATTYLGNSWLPLVALVSGLTDADAIAFSISNLHRQGLVGIDWASFNLVLGALSNTFMKLVLVFSLGSRPLFFKLLWHFLIIGGVGVLTMLVYFDLGPP